MLNVPHPMDESLSILEYAFPTYVLQKVLKFNSGLRCGHNIMVIPEFGNALP